MGRRRVALQTTLEPYSVELCLVKGTEFCRQAPECSDKTELQIGHVIGETDLRLLCKAKAILDFPLHFSERISRPDKQGVQADTAVRCVGEVADCLCNLEGLTRHITASQEMLHPWHDAICESGIGRSLEALQTTLFNQIIAELTESKCILVVAEPMPRYEAKPNIVDARTVVVAVLDAETNRPADDQGKKIRIRKQCRAQYLGQNIQSRDRRGVAHQGEVHNFLDLATSEP